MRTFLCILGDPPLTGGGGVGVTFLWRIFGLHKLIGKGDDTLALLRRIDDPPLTGGSGHLLALLRVLLGSHN